MRPLPLALLALVLALPAGAVVHTTGDGSGNITPPPDDPGFANVGFTPNGLSGVYLGNRWVLTADHVGEQNFTFAGVEHQVVPGSRVSIEKPPGTRADLALVRIVGHPPLPPVVLAEEPPKTDDVVTMVGNGWNREPDLVCWDAGFVETPCPAAFEGYPRLWNGRAIRWGRNVVTAVDLDVPLGFRTTRAFEAHFDGPGIADEAQSVTGDSGGAVFLKRGETWELAGIQFAMTAFAGQPSNTAVFGDSSLMVDVAHYRDEVDAVLATGVPQVPSVPGPALAVAAGIVLAAARRSLVRRAPDRPRRGRD